jgi:uncharacterized protein YjbI with pentapeptide repeats
MAIHRKKMVIHEDKQFVNINYSEKKLRDREFVKCRFVCCDFNKSDLMGNSFEDCHFERCNFTMAILDGTGFRNVTFDGCKLMGLDFTRCNKFMFSFSFMDCILDYSTFFGTKLKKTSFKKCTLKEVDFSEADLSAGVFENCDLHGTRFSSTVLEKTDFRTAANFAIDPDNNKIKKAKFAETNLAGLLVKYDLDIS